MDPKFKKRQGTSGIGGHLYETKLISLILFRLLHDDNIEDFYLASNLDDIGEFDDICIKIKLKDNEQPIRAFIQVKHKDNTNTFVTIESDLAKWCRSIIKVREKYSSNKSGDELISGEFDGTECQFILYTNAKCNLEVDIKDSSSMVTHLNTLLATSPVGGSRLRYTEKDISNFNEILINNEVTLLAKRFVKYIHEDPNHSMNIMNDEYVCRYHVILANGIVDVSEIQYDDATPSTKWRILTFPCEHETLQDDKYIVLLRKQIYDHILKSANGRSKIVGDSSTSESNKDELISLFLSNPSAETLSPLIETHLTWNSDTMKLSCISTKSPSQNITQKLEQINISTSVIDKAKAMAANDILKNLKVRVPTSFGNNDLALRGNKKKIDSTLSYLTEKIATLSQNYVIVESLKIVTIDDTIDKQLLSSNGRLGGIVGNILINDEITKLLKFSNSSNLRTSNAKSLLLMLERKIENLASYRFQVKTESFPKLSFDCTYTATNFLKKLLIYPAQSNHEKVGQLLRKEIEDQLSIGKCGLVTSEMVFLHYHNEVQKWWMTSNITPYFTKESNAYYQAISNIVLEPQIGLLENTFYMNKIKYFKYKFHENAIASLKFLQAPAKVIIVTDAITLTTVKVIQYLNNTSNKCVILDIELLLNMKTEDFFALNTELRNNEKIPVIVCENLEKSTNVDKRLLELKQVMENKKVIVITNNMHVKIIYKYFKSADSIVNFDNQSLIDMSLESQKEIIENSRVLFQGQKVYLSSIIDNESIKFIKGVILDDLVKFEAIPMGETLSEDKYDEIKHLYINRRIRKAPDDNLTYNEGSDKENKPNNIVLKTFYDIEDDIVFLTAKAGMGKSILLTHTSLKTKQLYGNIWIIRINMLYHSKEFSKWHVANINILQTMKFLCKVMLNNYVIDFNLKEIGNKIYLEDCTADEWVKFKLNMFLHFYNNRKLILLCDGFDEIYPDYKDTVIKFLEVVKNYPQKLKLWVTSRSYGEILADLKLVLGKPYGIESLNKTEQENFLSNYITSHVPLEKLFLNFQTINETLQKIYQIFKPSTSTPGKEENINDKLTLKYQRLYDIMLKYGIPAYEIPHDVAIEEQMPGKSSKAIKLKSVLDIKSSNIMETPLFLYLVADFVVSLLSGDINIVMTDLNLYNIYDMFVEKKLKQILYQDKNKMDIANPYIKSLYEEDRANYIILHKKLAVHELFGSPIFSQFGYFNEFEDMGPFVKENSKEHADLISKVKSIARKSGLIIHLTDDNSPIFVHRSFLEFFAMNFLTDILKSDKFERENRNLLMTAIVTNHMDMTILMIVKTLVDDELANFLNEFANQNLLLFTPYVKIIRRDIGNWSNEQYIRILNSSFDDYDADCFEGYQVENLETLDTEERVKRVKKFNETIVSKMKPHLKKFFI